MIKVFESFAGIGTQAMALKRANIDYEVIGISEIDKYAINSYEAIHGETKNYGDISKLDPKDLPDFDLFTYSFPCTSISMAGKQKGFEKGSGTRSSLLWECEKIIEAKRPKYLLMENVKALTFKKNKGGYQKWLDILTSLGYTNYSKVLNAKDYGIPQNRERVFCISILGDEEFIFPEKQVLTTRLKDVLEDKVDEKYYLSNDRIKQLVGIVRNWGVKGKTVFDSSINDPKEKEVANCITTKQYGISRRKSEGNVVVEKVLTIKNGNKKGYLEAHSGDGIDLINPRCNNRRGRVQKESCQTLTCNSDRGVVTDDLRIRKLTPLEYWRLMGIDDEDFYKARKVNSDSQLYKQAGNAIVVDVLAAIFMQLFKN